jgi:ribonuclease PH
VAALSSGFVDNKIFIDLDYEEDSNCDSDLNFVFTDKNEIIEVQGTAEGKAFSADGFNSVLNSTLEASQLIFEKQRQALGWETLIA